MYELSLESDIQESTGLILLWNIHVFVYMCIFVRVCIRSASWDRLSQSTPWKTLAVESNRPEFQSQLHHLPIWDNLFNLSNPQFSYLLNGHKIRCHLIDMW